MKSMLLLGVVLLGALASAQSAANPPNENHLIGAWRLVSLEETGADGHLHAADCDGMFVFTRDGKASVQVMYRNAEANSGSDYAQGGYEASYGSYSVDSSSIFTFHINGAIARSLIGKDLKRAYEISGNRLTVKSADPKEHWVVVWERY